MRLINCFKNFCVKEGKRIASENLIVINGRLAKKISDKLSCFPRFNLIHD